MSGVVNPRNFSSSSIVRSAFYAKIPWKGLPHAGNGPSISSAACFSAAPAWLFKFAVAQRRPVVRYFERDTGVATARGADTDRLIAPRSSTPVNAGVLFSARSTPPAIWTRSCNSSIARPGAKRRLH